MALGTDAPTALDVPEHLVEGSQLGRVVNYERALAVFGPGPVEHLARHYNIGDEVGYAAYLALRNVQGAPGPGRKMFLQALERGIDSVEGAPPELVALFKSVDEVPDWVDWDQLRRGSVAYWRVGKLTVMALAYAAIGAGFRTYGGSR
ncbi:MAG: oxygenase MpaB family protein, partial [Candidatus Rokuibacteriota bacterium]